MTKNHLKRKNWTFFWDIQPLAKVLIQLEKENLSIDERVLAARTTTNYRGQEKKLVSSAQMVLENQLY